MFERGRARGIVWNDVDLRLDQGITDAVLYTLLQNKVITVSLPTFWNPEKKSDICNGRFWAKSGGSGIYEPQIIILKILNFNK